MNGSLPLQDKCKCGVCRRLESLIEVYEKDEYFNTGAVKEYVVLNELKSVRDG